MTHPLGPPRWRRPAILIVGDVEKNLLARTTLLQRNDVDLLTARSGREAIELLLQRPVALAIIDVQMPEMDGFQLADAMRGIDRGRKVPIIFVTSTSTDERQVFDEARAIDFLSGPVDPHVLQHKVEAFVTLEAQRRDLRRSEARVRSLVEADGQAVWRMAGDGSAFDASPSFVALTGIDERDWLEGRWTNVVHVDDRPRVVASWREALENRTPWDAEYRLQRPGGHFTWTRGRMVPVLDETGALEEWMGSNTDIHARKEAESLRELLTGILRHDLRNPLTSILMATQVVLGRSDDENIRTPLRRVISSGERMVRMIEQLLDITRVRLGSGIELSPVTVDFGSVMAQVLSGMDRVLLETTGDLQGSWDVDRLFQIAANLVWNAADHSPAETKVRVTLDGSAPEAVRLSVHNHAPLIPPELSPDVFEQFDPSKPRKDRKRGLGLGLFITRQLVLAHGGTIGFDSTPETGTVFTVTLPRRAEGRAS